MATLGARSQRAAQNGSDGMSEGPVIQHIAALAILAVPSPLQLCYWVAAMGVSLAGLGQGHLIQTLQVSVKLL